MAKHPDIPGGFLNIDKPAGWTSHDAIARIRRITGIRRCGHAGTLDPMATGVLVVGLGRATRLLEHLMGRPKTYLAEITLGAATDTYDATGQVTASAPAPDLDSATLERSLDAFRGEIMQRPPAYSAIKRNGEALYKRARRGEIVEVEPRPVSIYELVLLDVAGPRLHLQIRCGAGTYIRSLAHDLGQALGCGGHLSSLRRTAVGSFTIDEALTLDQLEQTPWQAALRPPDQAVAHLERIDLTAADAARLLHGQSVPGPIPQDNRPRRLYGPAGHLLAIATFRDKNQVWQPLKVLAQS